MQKCEKNPRTHRTHSGENIIEYISMGKMTRPIVVGDALPIDRRRFGIESV